MKKLYKILEAGKSCHGGSMEWSLPNGKPGRWHEIAGDLKMCENGIHLTDKPAMWFRWNCEIYEAEHEGQIEWDSDQSKCVVRKARLLKKIPAPMWWTDAHRFVEKDIPSVKWLKPDLKPRKEWKLFKGVSWDAARDAARDAAWDACLVAMMKITQDLKIDKKRREHVKARWEVWEKGYALLCDVNGVLYVYAKEAE